MNIILNVKILVQLINCLLLHYKIQKKGQTNNAYLQRPVTKIIM